MTSDGDILFRAVCETLADDTPRLVYADWLQENGQPERAEFIRDVASGMAFINGMVTSYPELPFGGVKHSGFGRENGSQGIADYLDTKFVNIELPGEF